MEGHPYLELQIAVCTIAVSWALWLIALNIKDLAEVMKKQNEILADTEAQEEEPADADPSN